MVLLFLAPCARHNSELCLAQGHNDYVCESCKVESWMSDFEQISIIIMLVTKGLVKIFSKKML